MITQNLTFSLFNKILTDYIIQKVNLQSKIFEEKVDKKVKIEEET